MPHPHIRESSSTVETFAAEEPLPGLYARLYETWAPAHTVTPGQPWTPWSVEELVAILRAYVAEWGVYPPPSDLHPDCGLPYRSTVRRVCGSVEGWYALVSCVRSQVRHCLKCGREGSLWVCTACREKTTNAVGEAVAGDGSWMTGTLVQEPSGPVISEELEMIGLGPPASKTRRRKLG